MSILRTQQTKQDQHNKDPKRYSYSRFRTFMTCPRKHHYQYIEGIVTEESATTIPGKLFHECIEKFLKGEDMVPVFQEFRQLCTTGKLELEPDLLEYVVTKYLQYYAMDYSKENTLIVEYEYKDDLDDDDYLIMYVDQAYEKNGINVVRDMKTTLNKLKYQLSDVQSNQQLLLYTPYIENDLGIKIDAIEIDEIRLAKLQEVPINKNGKPSINKSSLELVTYEDYYDVLCQLGLETEKEYASTLDYLKSRGHPLFNRVKAQVLDSTVIDSNAKDLLATYYSIKNSINDACTPDKTFRIKGPLCNYCAYKELCEQEMHALTTAERNILIEKISKNNS